MAFLMDVHGAFRPDGLAVVQQDGIVALIGDQGPRLRLGRKALLRAAAARMARLESLMDHGTVLPTLADVCLSTEEARLAIRANRPVLDQAAARLRGAAQFQLRIGWDPDRAFARFMDRPGPFGPVRDATDLARRFGHWVDGQMACLDAAALDLPLAENLVVNRALLVAADRAPMLDRVVERIDALWSEGLSIRLVGPSPGVSFASIGLRRTGAADLRAALDRLGLVRGATAEAIRHARRGALMQADPRARPGIVSAADLAARAAAADWPEMPVPVLTLWSEDRAGSEPLRGAA